MPNKMVGHLFHYLALKLEYKLFHNLVDGAYSEIYLSS